VAYEDDIRAARGFKFHIKERGLDTLLAELDGLMTYLDTRGGPEAEATRRSERGGAKTVYIDFSMSVSNPDRWAIINLLRYWWGIPVSQKEFNFEGVWEEQWVLVLDETDWRSYEAYKQSQGFERSKDFLFGYHEGSIYPKGATLDEGLYRGYSFVNWRECRIIGGSIKPTVQDPILFSTLKQQYPVKFRFVHTEAYRDAVKTPGFFDDAEAKVAAWYACHELTHGIYKEKGGADTVTPFQAGIEGLEILLYYTEKGRSLINSTPGLDVGQFFSYFGIETWPEERKIEKPIRNR
jgi:hypothetical protein